MLATPIQLPSCLMQAYRFFFPTLDFTRIHFFDGIPWPFNTGQDGITLTSGFGETNIYLQGGTYHPCQAKTFQVIGHELVHALQIQSFPGGGVLPGQWIFNYLECGFLTMSFKRGNRFEDEGYDFQDWLSSSPLNPCQCVQITGPTPVPNLQVELEAAAAAEPRLIKREANVGLGDCLERPIKQVPVLGFIIGSLLFFLVAAITLLYDIADAILSLVQSIAHGLVSLFTAGGGEGNLNIQFSSDDGRTFHDHAVFERSNNQPGLAVTTTTLFIGWTGTDEGVNLLVAPSQAKHTFEKSQACGPALAVSPDRLIIAWQGDDNRLRIRSSADGMLFDPVVSLGETSPDNATPGLAYGDGWWYLAWIGTDNRLNLRSSPDGVTWTGFKLTLQEESGGDGTAALAYGNGRLFLGWAGTDSDNHLNVAGLSVAGNGTLTLMTKVTLASRSSDDAGPALAFGDNMLFLAWVDDNQTLRLATSADNGESFGDEVALAEANDNAGPALAFTPGVLIVSWLDQG